MAIFPGSVATNSDLYIAVDSLNTTLTDNPLGAGDTTVNVTSTTGFPSVGFITIESERIKYTGITATSFTGCVRGSLGSVAAIHPVTSPVKHNVVSGHHNAIKDDLIAVEQYLSDRFGLGSDLFIPSTKSLGVGVSPSAKLHVLNSANEIMRLEKTGGNDSNYRFNISSDISSDAADLVVQADTNDTGVVLRSRDSGGTSRLGIAINSDGFVGIGSEPAFNLDVQGASITGRFRSSTGPMSLDLSTGSNGGSNDVAIKLSDGISSTWVMGHDASDSNTFKIGTGSTLGSSEKFRIGTNGKVGIAPIISGAADDAPLNVFQDGLNSRPGIQLLNKNTGYTRVPMVLMQNFDAAANAAGNAIAFYGRDGITDIQHGIIAMSQKGATTSEARYELFLRSDGDALPVITTVGVGSNGYSYTLFGPNEAAPAEFSGSYANGAYTPASTVHIACDTGDVDSGLRIERRAATTGRFNFIINSSGSLVIRSVDDSTPGITMNSVNSVAIHGTETNDSATAGDVGEHISSAVGSTAFPTTGQYGDLTSISLTAGDWDISCLMYATSNGATVDQIYAGISTTSGNSATGLVIADNLSIDLPPTATADTSTSIPSYRMSLSATTTVYFKYRANYSVATPNARGRISARRVR